MSDIVERLRATHNCTQFDSAGRLITFEGEPTPLDLEAADEILRLRAELEQAQQAAKAECVSVILAERDRLQDMIKPMSLKGYVVKWQGGIDALNVVADTIHSSSVTPPPPQEGKT